MYLHYVLLVWFLRPIITSANYHKLVLVDERALAASEDKHRFWAAANIQISNPIGGNLPDVDVGGGHKWPLLADSGQ